MFILCLRYESGSLCQSNSSAAARGMVQCPAMSLAVLGVGVVEKGGGGGTAAHTHTELSKRITIDHMSLRLTTFRSSNERPSIRDLCPLMSNVLTSDFASGL